MSTIDDSRKPLRVNLGIVAHVDAGKTTLTEQLLYLAGVTHRVGSVDKGTTHTDSLELERRRGITIKAAVVGFTLGDQPFNLIDTPGHPDFIAEVERVLGLLDAAVLVVSAVEGVQAQTRVLMRTLRRLRIPTVVFINKIDRRGADPDRVIAELSGSLGLDVVAMGAATGCGTREATVTAHASGSPTFRNTLIDVLSAHDNRLLANLVENDAAVSDARLHGALVAQTRTATVHPVYLGSAATGAGMPDLVAGLQVFGSPRADPEAPLSAVVFKIDRGSRRERLAYVRVFSGELQTRSSVALGDREEVITSISVFDEGRVERREAVGASQIAQLGGLKTVRVGDVIGDRPPIPPAALFPPPAIEARITAARSTDRVALLDALTELADQDPLINLRVDPDRGHLTMSLYGEVQKQVIVDTLALDYRITAEFQESSVLHIERPSGPGQSTEPLSAGRQYGDPFIAGLGLRIDPAEEGSGVAIDLHRAHGAIPRAFINALHEAIEASLTEGIYGWPVTDCVVTVTYADYMARQSSASATFNRNVSTIANDFRILAPLVVGAALTEAGTDVCEPIHHFTLGVPTDCLGLALPALTRMGATTDPPDIDGDTSTISGTIAAAQVQALLRELPALTRGEGKLETFHGGFRPVRSPAPTRLRTTDSPFNRDAYLLSALRRLL